MVTFPWAILGGAHAIPDGQSRQTDGKPRDRDAEAPPPRRGRRFSVALR